MDEILPQRSVARALFALTLAAALAAVAFALSIMATAEPTHEADLRGASVSLAIGAMIAALSAIGLLTKGQ